MNLKSLIAATLLLTSAAANAGVINYATGTTNPWGNTTNDTAMTTAFGASNWNKSMGFAMSVFNNADFVFLDGSDQNATQLSSFLSTNSDAIASYVFNGGHLFLNAAPNVGGSFDMGFGVTLNKVASGSVTVTQAGVAAGLTAGSLATSYTGGSFGHATVSGGGITGLINMAGSNSIVFGAKQYGSGFVAFGGETTVNFHQPSANAAALRVNELRYVANAATNVPEPATLALFGLGLLGAAAVRRKSAR